ncbi:hypothetical protein FRB95_001449 [Tulasnella sp. JGI-2019a]|nr:hypothetical protein FRB95_001449 [Tulasnella sp. JGI-2019a]
MPSLSPTSVAAPIPSPDILSKEHRNRIRFTPLIPIVNIGNSSTPAPAAAPWAEQEITAYRALLAVNAASIACCVLVLLAYWIIRRCYPRIMRRLSLKLVACMAVTELILHTSNLAGYGKLPTDGFLCGFIGGFFFAYGSMTAIFYACAVALNCSLVFVFAKRPSQGREKYFIFGPPLLSLIICLPTLATGVYGYDDRLQYCWFASCLIAFLYLFTSCVFVIRAVFSPQSSALQVSMTVDGFAPPDPSLSLAPSDRDTFSPTRRSQAIRRLVLRLIGFISVPCVCVISGIVLDILGKTGTEVSPHLDAGFEVVAGLMGTLNGLLFLVDPGVLAVLELRRGGGGPFHSPAGTPSAWSLRNISEEGTPGPEKRHFDDLRMMRFNHLGSPRVMTRWPSYSSSLLPDFSLFRTVHGSLVILSFLLTISYKESPEYPSKTLCIL